MSDRKQQSKEYDWIDDPFKDEPQHLGGGMGSKSKVAIGCGCLVVLIVIVVCAVMLFSGLSSILSA